MMKNPITQQLNATLGAPSEKIVTASRRHIDKWFAHTAPLIRWDTLDSPLGVLYVATSDAGLCSVEIGVSEEVFLAHLNPLACTHRDPSAIGEITTQFREYFNRQRSRFELALDLSRVPDFQRRVLEAIHAIPAGTVWTYSQVAQAIGRPSASRAVGHALSTNPLLIVAPCHRVIASDGSLRGYKAGLDRKRQLLQLEGAL